MIVKFIVFSLVILHFFLLDVYKPLIIYQIQFQVNTFNLQIDPTWSVFLLLSPFYGGENRVTETLSIQLMVTYFLTV